MQVKTDPSRKHFIKPIHMFDHTSQIACHGQTATPSNQQRTTNAKSSGASTIATAAAGAATPMPSKGSASSRLATIAFRRRRTRRWRAADSLRVLQRRHGLQKHFGLAIRMLQRTEPPSSMTANLAPMGVHPGLRQKRLTKNCECVWSANKCLRFCVWSANKCLRFVTLTDHTD